MADQPLQHATPGSPFDLKAEDWNRVVDATSHVLRGKIGSEGPGSLNRGPLIPSLRCRVSWSGGDLSEFAILTYDTSTPAIDPASAPFETQATPVFAGTTPGASTDAVLITAAPYNATAAGLIPAISEGLAVCTVNVVDALHGYANPSAGVTSKLTSAVKGSVRIIYKPAGTGDKTCIVHVMGTSSPRNYWLARLTTASGGFWKYFQLGWTGSAYGDVSSESAGFTAAPWAIDGSNLCNPVAGLRVLMFDSDRAGYQEFLPIGYADLAGGTYCPGLWNVNTLAVQTFTGDKQLDGDWSIRDSLASNSGATYETLRYKARTTGSAPPVPPAATAMGDEFASYTQFKVTTVGPHTYKNSGGYTFWPTSSDRVTSVAGKVFLVNQLAIFSSSDLTLTDPQAEPVCLYVMQDPTAGNAGNPVNWMCISLDLPASATFPSPFGLQIMSGLQVSGGFGYVAIGLNETILTYDFVGGAVGGIRYGGGTGGGYWRGFQWQGGNAGPFRVADGIITGYSTTSTAAGQITYFNGTNWVILAAPGAGPLVLTGNSGAISWAAGGSGTVTGGSGGTTGLTLTGSTTLTLGGTLGAANGGTGLTTATTNGVIFGNGTGAMGVTSAPTSGQLLIGGSAPDFKTMSGDATITSAGVLTIGSAKVTLAKIANAAASSKLVGSGASGSGAAYVEIALGSGLTMTGTTLSASGGSPGGSDTYVQFNDAGSFGGVTGLTFDKTTKQLSVSNGSGIEARLVQGNSIAGEFQDGARAVDLCDGTYAVNAFAGMVRTLGSSGNTYRVDAGTTAPGTNGGTPTTRYGGDTNYCGDPDAWILVNIGGTNYKVPAFL